MTANADENYPWNILAANLRAELSQQKQNDLEITRLQIRQGEIATRVALLEKAITDLGGDLVKARAP